MNNLKAAEHAFSGFSHYGKFKRQFNKMYRHYQSRFKRAIKNLKMFNNQSIDAKVFYSNSITVFTESKKLADEFFNNKNQIGINKSPLNVKEYKSRLKFGLNYYAGHVGGVLGCFFVVIEYWLYNGIRLDQGKENDLQNRVREIIVILKRIAVESDNLFNSLREQFRTDSTGLGKLLPHESKKSNLSFIVKRLKEQERKHKEELIRSEKEKLHNQIIAQIEQ